MSRRPSAPEVWEQALVNSRRLFPHDSAKALQWAEEWYLKQGQRFIESPVIAPEVPQQESAPIAEPEAETPATEAPAAEPVCPMPVPAPSSHEESKASEPKAEAAPRRRSRRNAAPKPADASDT
jgi:hypothetical protein